MLRPLLRTLWRDTSGFVVSSESVLLATLVVIGLVAGITTLRDQVMQELADTANSIGNTNQSYSMSGVTGHASSTAGSMFGDSPDFCAPRRNDDIPPIFTNVGIGRTIPASPE